MRNTLTLAVIALGLLSGGGLARAGVFISTQFLGTPRESNLPGARTMPGWGAGVPTLFSTGGPILSVDFGRTAAGGEPYGIYAALGQRWQSSQSNGVYDVSTPGPINVYNGQSDLSFDSHFINNNDRVFTIPPTEGNIIFPGLNPIRSTPDFGFGHGAFPSGLTNTGHLRGKFEMTVVTTEVSLAYLTFGSSGTLFGKARTTDGDFEFGYGFGWTAVPEPSHAAAVATVICRFLIRSRRVSDRSLSS